MRKRNTIIIAAIVAASALITGCGEQQSAPAGQQVTSGSRVVPAARIAPQVRAILPYYQYPGTGQGYGNLWKMETGLADALSNVSSLDNPRALARAEAGYANAVLDAQTNGNGPNMPFYSEIDTAIHALAIATGVEQPIVPGGST